MYARQRTHYVRCFVSLAEDFIRALPLLSAAYRRRTTPQLFKGGKVKFFLGRGDALRPRPTFEAKSRQKPPEGFRSPQTPANGSCREQFK